MNTRPVVVDVWRNVREAFPKLAACTLTIEPPPAGTALPKFGGNQFRRRLLTSPEGLAGPILLAGDCLAPMIEGSPWCWFDSTLAPQHRDLVLVSIEPGYCEQLIETAWADESRHAELSGQHYENVLVKQLVLVDTVPALIAAEGLLPVTATIRGVLRFMKLPRVREVGLDELQKVIAGSVGDLPG